MKREYIEKISTISQLINDKKETITIKKHLITMKENSKNSEPEQTKEELQPDLYKLKEQLTVSYAGITKRPADMNLHCLFKCTFRDGLVGQGVVSLNVAKEFDMEPGKTKLAYKKTELTRHGLPLMGAEKR
eukprot:UN04713